VRPTLSVLRLRSCFLLAALLIAPAVARADMVDAAQAAHAAARTTQLDVVLDKLELHAAQFEKMKRRASYTILGKMERVDGSGKVAETKEMTVKVNGMAAEVVRYVEDGLDKTADERAKRGGTGRISTGKVTRMRLPFLASERPKYTFRVKEVDANYPYRLLLEFAPKTPADDTALGTAWVDARAGEVLTIRFSPTKKPKFVDDIDIAIHFDSQTSLGRAPSKVTFEASGGFLFIRKRYRGTATITNTIVNP
jgi:hypothetical protein